MSVSDQIRALPLWVIISAAVFFGILVFSPLFIGFFLERRRTAPARADENRRRMAARQSWLETGEIDLDEIREKHEENKARKVLPLDSGQVQVIRDSAPVQVIQDERPTLVLPAVPPVRELEAAPIAGFSPYSEPFSGTIEIWRDPETGAVETLDLSRPFDPEGEDGDELPGWARESTAEWDVDAILDAEIVDTEIEAERLFWKDPLGSWTLPPERETPDFLPLADRAFWALVNRNALSGEGANVDTLYTPLFTDYELEEVYA